MSKVYIGNIKGPDGKSAYEVAVEDGFEGTEQEWLDSLKGDVTPEAEELRDAAAAAAGVASDAASDAEGHAAEVKAVVATNDGIMKAVAADPESEFSAQLNATMVQALTSRVQGNGITEWWINPVATLLRDPYERVVSGELGDPVAGESAVLFVERQLSLGTVKRYEIAFVAADDHCVPAVHAEAGRRFLVVYQNHNGDQLLRFKVSDRNGTGRSLVIAPEVTRSMGASVSYANPFKVKHLSDDTQDTFVVLYRHGTFAWGYITVTVNQATGAVTFGQQRLLISSGTEQCYVAAADAYEPSEQTIRLGFGYNPTANLHAIRMLYWNLVTGEITDQVGTVLADTSTGANLPVADTTVTPLVAEPASGWNRRFVYTRPGPDSMAALYIDYQTTNVAGTSQYKLTEGVPEQTIPGDEFNGLIPGEDGYASAPAAVVDLTAGFEFTWIGTLPAAAQQAGIAHRYDGTGTGVWWLRIDQSGNIGAWVRTNLGVVSVTYGGGAPLAGSWGDEVGIRLLVDAANNIVRRYYSLNPRDASPTWTQYGSGTSLGGAASIASSTTLPLVVSSSSTTLMGVQAVKSAVLKTLAGTTTAGTDFETDWAKGATTDVDTQGVTWTLNGSAYIGDTDPAIIPATIETHDLGPAGGYFGYTYLRGGCFETPSRTSAVILATEASGVETIKRLIPDGAGWDTEVVHQAMTADHKLIRPYSPIGAGPGMLLLNRVTDYSPTGFTAWSASTELVAV